MHWSEYCPGGAHALEGVVHMHWKGVVHMHWSWYSPGGAHALEGWFTCT